MPNPAVAGIGLSVLGGMSQASAARKASAAQQAAADAQIAESRHQFDTVQGLLRPYVGAGTGALDQYLALVGLGGLSAVNGTPANITTLPGAADPTAARVQPGGGVFGMGFHGRRDERPTGMSQVGLTQTPAGPRYSVNGQIFNSMDEAQAFANANRTYANDPAANQRAQQQAIDALANGSQFKALVGQGEDAILANASATGGLRGGDTAGALAQFRPQMLQALIDKQLANLGGLATNGQNAAAMTGTAAQNLGTQVNAALGDRGAAAAGGYLARAKAQSGMFGDIAGTLGQFTGANGGIPAGATLFSRWGF